MASGILTLAQIRLAARQRADMETSKFVKDSEFNSNINQSLYELYDLLIQKSGDDYFLAPTASFKTDGTNQLYALPDGTTLFLNDAGGTFAAAPFYKMLGVDLSLYANPTPDQRISLRRFNFGERNKVSRINLATVQGLGILPRYSIKGNKIMFTPLPQSGLTISLWYAPRLTELVNDSDTSDGVSGWLEYVIVDAAIKAMQKEESDVTILMAQKQALIDRIEAASENRDQGEPMTVTDITRANGNYGRGEPFTDNEW